MISYRHCNFTSNFRLPLFGFFVRLQVLSVSTESDRRKLLITHSARLRLQHLAVADADTDDKYDRYFHDYVKFVLVHPEKKLTIGLTLQVFAE